MLCVSLALVNRNLTCDRVSSKATLRIPTSSLLPLVPPLLHRALLDSLYYASNSHDLVIQADDARKQNANVLSCFKKLHELIVDAGRQGVPGETSAEQLERVEKLQKAEAVGRRKIKEHLSKKKSARRSGGRGDD